MCSLVALLLADSRDTTRTKSGGASTDEFGKTTEKLKLRPSGLDSHLVDKDIVSLLQVLEGVVLDVGEERGVERVGLLQRADVGTLEELDLRLLVQVDEDETEAAEGFELPGADLSGEELTVRVLPKQEDEFTCSRCFLVQHRSRLAATKGDQLYCRDCAA